MDQQKPILKELARLYFVIERLNDSSFFRVGAVLKSQSFEGFRRGRAERRDFDGEDWHVIR
jgi:hypothetical protein